MNGSNKAAESVRESVMNAKVKFTQSGVNEDGKTLLVQIGFELPEGKTAMTPRFRFTPEVMMNILNVLEVRNWEELPKKYARVAMVGDRISMIGNILNEKWVKL